MSSAVLAAACGGGGGGDAEPPTDDPAQAPAPAPAPAGTATLTWTAPVGTVTGYRVYYGIASRSYSQALGGGAYVTKTSFTLSSLPAGSTYYFAVTAVDAAGVESAYSNEASKLIP